MNEIIEYGDPLHDDETAFVLAYLQCFNSTEAIKLSGLLDRDAPRNIAAAQGYRMMAKPRVIAAIEQHFRLQTMTAAETLARLTEQARGEYAQYIQSNGTVDLNKMKEDGKLHLIKSVKKTKWGTDVTFIDPQFALALLAKHHNLLGDKSDKGNEAENKPPTYIVIEQPK